MAKVYYTETFGGIYSVDDAIINDEEKLTDDVMTQFSIHNECQGSITVPLIGRGKPDFQIMGGIIDALSDEEKEFYLWHLLRYYYIKKLNADKEKYADDKSTVDQINRLLDNVEEIDTLLVYDLF